MECLKSRTFLQRQKSSNADTCKIGNYHNIAWYKIISRETYYIFNHPPPPPTHTHTQEQEHLQNLKNCEGFCPNKNLQRSFLERNRKWKMAIGLISPDLLVSRACTFHCKMHWHWCLLHFKSLPRIMLFGFDFQCPTGWSTSLNWPASMGEKKQSVLQRVNLTPWT